VVGAREGLPEEGGVGVDVGGVGVWWVCGVCEEGLA